MGLVIAVSSVDKRNCNGRYIAGLVLFNDNFLKSIGSKRSEFFVFGFKVEYLKEFSQTFKIQCIARSSTSTDGSFVSGV